MVQPSGTVTLVFTDIEGSTALLDELGAEAFKEALADHRRAVLDVTRVVYVDKRNGRFAGLFEKPSDGLEPSTPSLP
jgi:hypothetical protein